MKQKRDAQRARHEAQTADEAREIANALSGTVLRFDVKAGPTGSLFGSVTPTNITDELWRTKKIRIDRRKVGIDTIKRIGRYEVPIELFQDVHASVQTEVVPEGGELPSDEELAALEAQERGEPETPPAAEATTEPTLEEVLAAEDEAAAEDAPEPHPEAEDEAEDEAEAGDEGANTGKAGAAAAGKDDQAKQAERK